MNCIYKIIVAVSSLGGCNYTNYCVGYCHDPEKKIGLKFLYICLLIYNVTFFLKFYLVFTNLFG